MRCFVHHDHEAIGICRACGKALCPDCAVDLGHAICCRGACEEETRKMRALTIRSRELLKAQQRNRFFAPAYLIFFGILGVGFGLSQRDWFNFLTAMGACFAIFGIRLYLINRRLYKKVDGDKL